jgi:hypothetical protein
MAVTAACRASPGRRKRVSGSIALADLQLERQGSWGPSQRLAHAGCWELSGLRSHACLVVEGLGHLWSNHADMTRVLNKEDHH